MTYGDHNHSVVSSGNLWQYVQPSPHPLTSHQFTLTSPIQEPKMTVAEEIAKERQDKLERKRLELWWDDLEEVLPEGSEPCVIRFNARFKDRTYTYAAVWTGEHWYATGVGAPQQVGTHFFIKWLIDREVEPDAIQHWPLS